jgi:hypothetical protein
MLRIQRIDKKHKYDEFKFVFSNVFEKHYFAELFLMGTSQRSSIVEKPVAKDLRVLLMTWNQGGKDVDGFRNLDKMIPNL